jgi:hypothetical protein
MVLVASSVLAQELLDRDPKPGEDGWVDIPASINRIPPPESNHSTFVIDQGTGLDTGCTFSGSGPLIITLPINGGNSNVSGVKATLAISAWDVDFASGEHDRVSFNGHVVSNPGPFLTGFNMNWEISKFKIPVEWILDGDNKIQIDIDVDNYPSERWCAAIDWVAVGIPYIPGLIDLNSFTATPTNTGVNFEWETASEMNNLGMNLWCAQMRNGQFEGVTKLNSQVIPSKAQPNSGASYSWISTNLEPGVQHCALEDIDASGQCTVHCDQIDTVVIGNNLPATELNRLKAEAIALCQAHELNGACLDTLVAPVSP